jgi:tetratricopeptide (TPR) repeat protein
MVQIVVVVVVVAAASLGALWYFLQPSNAPQTQYSTELTPYSVLATENMAFIEAEQLMRTGDYLGARAKYTEALGVARDSVQEWQIKYKIATTYELLGDYVTAIRLFKEIAASPDAAAIFKSYAVMKLGAIFNTYGFGAQEDIVVQETFTGSPYDLFLEGDDISLAYRKLYEYSSSFYPVAVSELRIADWHVNYIRSQGTRVSQEELMPHAEIVLQKLESAARDTIRISKDPNEAALLSEVFTRQAEVVAKLASAAVAAGEPLTTTAREKGVTFESAEESYRRALELRVIQGTENGQDGMIRFLYASFLERFIPGRESDIRTILAPLYESSVYKNSPVLPFLSAQRGADSWMNRSLVGMAAIDPKFKQLLLSLGWTDADF